MEKYLYLSLIPESLIASMLPPDAFGSYYAIGTRKRSRGQAMFFELDLKVLEAEGFAYTAMLDRCVSHPDGSPKRSLYVSVYRALESVPLNALKRLYLVTDDGRTLGLDPAPYPPVTESRLHLYQEICPVTPRVVSTLDPFAFVRFITRDNGTFTVPKIVFCNLILRGLRNDPSAEDVGELPYRNIGHLRDCLRELRSAKDKVTKTVQRQLRGEILYRTIKDGFFVGEGDNLVFFPMPSLDRLEREYYQWWRSALVTSLAD